MIHSSDQSRTVISKVRVRSRGVDALSTRLRIESWLSAMHISSSGLSPSAILLIRRLADPLPNRLRLHQSAPTPQSDWEQAMRAKIGALASRASRPARGFVSSNAEAVLFADNGELLACLARDWTYGDCTQWWWRSLFPQGVDEGALLRTWCERIGSVPSAMASLHRSGVAYDFVRRLSVAAVQGITESLVASFGLGALVAAREIAPSQHEVLGAAMPPPVEAQRALTSAGHRKVDAPWNEWIAPADVAQLTVAQVSLLGIAVALAQAPSRARSTVFANTYKEWLAQRSAGPEVRPPASPTFAITAFKPSMPRGSPDDGVRPHPYNRNSYEDLGPSDQLRPPEPLATSDNPETASRAITKHEPLVREMPQRTDVDDDDTLADKSLSLPTEQAAAIDLTDTAPSDLTIGTKYGGVFYLINLALFLELYSDFTSPLRPGLPLSIWDFVALIGEDLAGADIRNDPVWELLARFAGRLPTQAPGAAFDPPAAWRTPIDWLTPFAINSPWTWSARGGRLRIHHPAGSSVIDVPLAKRSIATALEEELRPYHLRGLATGLVRVKHELRRARRTRADMLQRWLAWLTPYIRIRLCLALGLLDGADPGPLLCRHEATVRVGTDTLDMYLRLDDLPFEIRLAGLDRDPGWVPAAGRAIRFYFN